MNKIFITILVLLFLPAFSQVKHPINNIKSDTLILIGKIKKIHAVNSLIVDKIKKISEKRDSIENARKGIFVRSYNSDAPNGQRIVWNFVYKIDGKDTIFQRVKKEYTYWEPKINIK